MDLAPPTRRQALTDENLSDLGRVALRKLCQVLIVERELRLTRVQPRADLDDFHTEVNGLWEARQGRVRLVHRPLRQDDVRDLAEVARAEPLADAVLIEGAQGGEALTPDSAVQIVRAGDVVARIRASALVEWEDGKPKPALDRLALTQDLREIIVALDSIGLRWLPTLALNRLPPELTSHGTADDLFEGITFRILTTALRFRGRRLGTRRRGERLPDAVLRWTENGGCWSALLDCKAAQYGYRMDVADQRALVEYFQTTKDTEADDGCAPSYVVIVSSDFDGEPGEGHPFHARAQALRNEAGANLVYVRATDLVQLAVAVERDQPDTAERESIPWTKLFDLGMPASGEVAGMWPLEG